MFAAPLAPETHTWDFLRQIIQIKQKIREQNRKVCENHSRNEHAYVDSWHSFAFSAGRVVGNGRNRLVLSEHFYKTMENNPKSERNGKILLAHAPQPQQLPAICWVISLIWWKIENEWNRKIRNRIRLAYVVARAGDRLARHSPANRIRAERWMNILAARFRIARVRHSF